ncbi:hypothetical protein IW261DRAFT_1483211 [Armillaria novae-zelandiae]|uniref:REJ domain-containing protein n=1 Tax=Armillaria novae-zelandiae TaxID=153914 RepID=A0AA39P6W4_9AGAR|nr:hypothetical protein IW261DRAFT_1483211 [Armillaria novae-zelandiae]
MRSTSAIQSVLSSSSSVAISGSSAPLTSLIATLSSSFAAAGSTSIEPIISTTSVSAASSAESATDNSSLSSVIIQSDRQAGPSVAASPMSSAQERQAEYVPVAAPPDTGDGTSSTSTSSSEVVVTTSSSSTTVQAPPTTNTVTSTQPGTTVTTTNPGTTNDAPTASATAPVTSEERPLESAAAATATATVTQQTGAPASGSSNVSSKHGDSDCIFFAYLATDGDNSGTSGATGIVAPSVNPAASTVSTVHSTLPQAVGVTVTGANGQTSVTFPSFVTVLSTATESDGTVVTESAVVSNPTGLGQPGKNGNSSFFSNTSAVAGTFAAVGIVVFAVLALLLVCCRRRRRQKRARTRWLTAITQPPSYPLHDDADRDPFEDDPFEDPRDAPQMTQVTNAPQTTYINRDQRHEDSEHVDTEDSTANLLGVRNFAATPLDAGPITRTQEEGPFSDVNMFSPQEAIGLAITTNYPVPSLHSRQSTPSLYSDSPQVHGDADSFYDIDPGSPPAVPPKTETRPAAPPAIPRPPRSILRGAPPSRGSEYRPLTPPDSVESHRFSVSSSSAGPATPTGLGFATGSSFDHETAKLATPLAPTLSPTAILTRRTLLDVCIFGIFSLQVLSLIELLTDTPTA